MEIGEKIRFWGVNKFGNVTLFAEALEMGLPNLHKYLKGNRDPGLVVLKKLHNLGCNINWLLADEGNVVMEKSEQYGNSDKQIIKEQQQKIKELESRLSKIEKLLK